MIDIRDASDVRLTELIDAATNEATVRLVAVADEVQGEQLRPLRDLLDHGQGRIRRITIGHSKTPNPVRIPEMAIPPLDHGPMAEVARRWYPAITTSRSRWAFC